MDSDYHKATRELETHLAGWLDQQITNKLGPNLSRFGEAQLKWSDHLPDNYDGNPLLIRDQDGREYTLIIEVYLDPRR